MAILTIRLVRSFEYRNVKTIILREVDLNQKASELKKTIQKGKNISLFHGPEIEATPAFAPFLKMNLGTLDSLRLTSKIR